LADCRHAAGYTQESFAEQLGVDRSTIGRWERGVQSPQPWQRPDIAVALGISLDHLDDMLRRTKQAANAAVAVAPPFLEPFEPLGNAERDEPGSVRAFCGDDAVHAAIPRLRRALDCLALPEDGPTRSLNELAADVAGMIEHRLQARYAEMAWRLPALISELARAHTGAGRGSRDAAALLTLAFRAADGVAYKFGYLDLSARNIDLMRACAATVENPLLMAAVAYVHTETFLRHR
jgi:transcriptional regulator with XRE-family HTH domain